MSTEDVIAGFHNLANLQQRDEKFQESIGVAVDWNSALLNAVVTRVNALEAVVNLHSEAHKNTEEKVNGFDQHGAGKAWVLRGELSAMAVKLEAQHAELKVKLAELDKGPVLPPGIASSNPELLSMNLNKVNIVVDELKGKAGALEKHAEQAVNLLQTHHQRDAEHRHRPPPRDRQRRPQRRRSSRCSRHSSSSSSGSRRVVISRSP